MKKLIFVLLIIVMAMWVIIPTCQSILLIKKENEKKKNCTEETIGTVVQIDARYRGKTGSKFLHYPIIEYDVGDKKIRKLSDHGSSPSKYVINEKIDILYNPNKIDEYVIKGDKDYAEIYDSIEGSIVFLIMAVVIISKVKKALFEVEN